MTSAPAGLKIVIVGPSGSGKTAIANFLAGQTANDSLEAPTNYLETKGCRILECEKQLPGRGTKSIEIWDVSGNSAFESGWPAISQHADGVVLVYNPEKAGNDTEVGDWFDEFVKGNPSRITDPAEQVLVFAHHPGSAGVRHASRVPAKIKVAGLGVVETGYDSAAATVLQQTFVDFLAGCATVRGRRPDDE